MKNKKILILLGILIVVFGGYFSVQIKSNLAEKHRIERAEKFKKSYHDIENVMRTRVMPILYQKEREIKEKQRLEWEKHLAEIQRFVKVDGLKMYKTPAGEILNRTYPKASSVLLMDTDEERVVDGVKYVCVTKDFSDSNSVWVKESDLTKDRKDLMYRFYDGVDYSAQKKVKSYPSNPKKQIRGVYVTGHTASGSIDNLIEFAKRTKINAFVIDFKDDSGNMLFYSEAAEKYVPSANKHVHIKDPVAFMKKLKQNNIYAIARIVTFKSPRYSKRYLDRSIVYSDTNELFKSRDGITWASPYDRQLWDYNIDVAMEAVKYGFNEIQFDYVRFPDTGGMNDKKLNFQNKLNENKTQAIQGFLKQAYKQISAGEVYVAADVFGWTATAQDDVGIGQHWEAMTNVVDYMCPMVYPSHYGAWNFGLDVPDAHPYETIDRAIKDSINRNKNVETSALLRPWIQNFTASWIKGHIPYGAKEVELQIKALHDNGIDEYILWSPSNIYSEDALK